MFFKFRPELMLIVISIFSVCGHASPLFASDFECSNRAVDAAMGMAQANMPITGGQHQIFSKVMSSKVKNGVKIMKIEAFRVDPSAPFPDCVYSPRIFLQLEFKQDDLIPWAQCVVRSALVSDYKEKESDWISAYCQ